MDASDPLAMLDPPPGPEGPRVTVRTSRTIRRLIIACVVVELLLLVGDVVINWNKAGGAPFWSDGSVRKIFNIAREESLPTWFASIQALFVGITCFLIFRAAGVNQAGKLTRLGWFLIAAFFVFISFDDAAAVHERTGSALGRMFERAPEEQSALVRWLLEFNTYHWQLFVMPAFALFGLFMFIFLWRHFGRYGLRATLIVGLVSWITAICMDIVEGIEDEDEVAIVFEKIGDKIGQPTGTVSHFSKAIEEMLEMFGTTMLWFGFLLYLAAVTDGFRIHLTRKSR